MKRFTCIALMIICHTTLFAQKKEKHAKGKEVIKKEKEEIKKTDHHISILPEAGLNISGASAKKPDMKFSGTPLPGIQFGCRVDIPIVQMLSFRPGILFSYESTKKDLYGDDTKFHVFYLKIPLDFVYHITPKIYAGFGPYLGVALTGKYDWRGNKTSIEWGKDENTDDLKRLDIGLGFSGGYMITPRISLGGKLDVGLRDISAQPNVKIRTISFAATASYRLGK